MEKKQKVKFRIVFLCFFVLLAGIVWGIYIWAGKAKEETADGWMPGEGQGRSELENTAAASGVTVVGLEEIKYELDTGDAKLVIEEIYAASGDETKEGGKILKFTQESVEEVRRELYYASVEAGLAYREGVMDYGLAVLEAEKERDAALLEMEYAESVCELSIAEANSEADQLKGRLEDAEELYEEYDNGINNNGYEKEYELAEKKNLYETNEKLYWETLKKWNLDDSQINNSRAGGTEESMNQSGSRSMSAGGGQDGTDPWQIKALEALEDTYRAEKEAYEQAQEDCKKAIEAAAAGMDQARADYELLALEVSQAEIEYEKKAAAAQADYEMAVAKGNAAETDYQTAVKSRKETLETLKTEKEEAAEAYALFESDVADGFLYADGPGTIVAVMAAKGQELEKDDRILAYSNPEQVTVTASVDQNDIASVAVGDNALIVSEEYGSLSGTVTQLNPVSGSGKKANVTYTVEILLDPGEIAVEANHTVMVYFGAGNQGLLPAGEGEE